MPTSKKKALKFTDEAKRTAYIRSAESDKGIYTNPVAYSAIQALFIFYDVFWRR